MFIFSVKFPSVIILVTSGSITVENESALWLAPEILKKSAPFTEENTFDHILLDLLCLLTKMEILSF